MKLTARRRAILAEIAAHTAARGFPPSLMEIGAAAGLGSTSSVGHHLGVLVEAGLLRPAVPHLARTQRLADGVAVSRGGLVARAVAVSHCPRCLICLPDDHDCPTRPEESRHA